MNSLEHVLLGVAFDRRMYAVVAAIAVMALALQYEKIRARRHAAVV